MKSKEAQYKILSVILAIALIVVVSMQVFKYPSNSLELHSWLLNEENLASLDDEIFLTSTDKTAEEIRDIYSSNNPHQVNQFTFINMSGGARSILIETSPGYEKFKVIRVIEVNEEVEAFLESSLE